MFDLIMLIIFMVVVLGLFLIFGFVVLFVLSCIV